MKKELISHIRELFEKPSLEFQGNVTAGFLSQNFILEENGVKFFLKQYRQTKEGRIKEIHSIKFFFAEHGIPAVLPLKTKDGNTFFSFENSFFALFPFVNGKRAVRGCITVKELQEMGKLLARIHLLSKKIHPKSIGRAELESGILMYFMTKAQSLWIEKTHYLEKSTRVDLFQSNEYKTLLYLNTNRAEFLKKLLP